MQFIRRFHISCLLAYRGLDGVAKALYMLATANLHLIHHRTGARAFHRLPSKPFRRHCLPVSRNVCVYVLSSHLFWAPVFTFWARQPGSHRRKANTKENFISYLFLVFHLPSAVLAFSFSIARRVQHSLSLVYREVEFCVPTTESLSTVGFCARKKPTSLRDLNPRPNRQAAF